MTSLDSAWFAFAMRGVIFAALVLCVACERNGALSSYKTQSRAVQTAVAARQTLVPPTATVATARPQVPTPLPPVQCRFGTSDTVAVPVNVLAFAAAAPGTAPPFYRGTPGWQILILATGEPLPGVHLELHLPTTMFVAGAVIRPEVWVNNTSVSGVAVLASAGILDRDQKPIVFDQASSQRSGLNGGAHSRPGPILGSTVVP